MSVQYKDYYQSLGVPRTASADEIKKSFRKLAREFHPDVAKDKKKAEEKFKEINEAYEVLSDPDKRKKYDELGANWKSGAEFRPPPGYGGFGGGQAFRGGRAAGGEEFHFRRHRLQRFLRAAFRLADARRAAAALAGAEIFHRRILPNAARTSKATSWSRSKKPRAVPCAPSTSATATATESHQVKIPPGISEGQKLRLAGRGESGSGGGENGDLYLRVRFAKHPDFDVDGHNLIYELELAPWEAALGAEISVPTLDGRVNIKIPAGTPSGQKLRVRGRGLAQRDGTHGDLMVVTKIVVPEKISDARKKIVGTARARIQVQPEKLKWERVPLAGRWRDAENDTPAAGAPRNVTVGKTCRRRREESHFDGGENNESRHLDSYIKRARRGRRRRHSAAPRKARVRGGRDAKTSAVRRDIAVEHQSPNKNPTGFWRQSFTELNSVPLRSQLHAEEKLVPITYVPVVGGLPNIGCSGEHGALICPVYQIQRGLNLVIDSSQQIRGCEVNCFLDVYDWCGFWRNEHSIRPARNDEVGVDRRSGGGIIFAYGADCGLDDKKDVARNGDSLHSIKPGNEIGVNRRSGGRIIYAHCAAAIVIVRDVEVVARDREAKRTTSVMKLASIAAPVVASYLPTLPV